MKDNNKIELNIFVWKSGSWKSAIVDELNKIFKTEKPINYTTRDMRKWEENGSDYNFVSEETFISSLKDWKLLEFVCDTHSWNFYWIPKPNKNNKFIILEPLGTCQAKKFCFDNNIKCNIFYIEVEEDKRIERMKKDWADSKRLSRNELRFDEFKWIYNYTINNSWTMEDSIKQIKNILNK